MTDKIQISITATIPRELLYELVQHVRDFDVAYADCHFGIFAAGGAISADEMESILKRVKPPFAVFDVMKKN